MLTYYSEDVLEGIAHAHGFADEMKFQQGTLSEWLYNKMLDRDYMRELFLYMSDDELEFFRDAIDENGISIDEEVVNQFLFISTYGTFNVQELLVIPQEVQEKYQEIYTEEIAMKRMRNQTVMHYCRSAIELYGVIPLSEFIRIYTSYEMEELTETELMRIVEKYQDEEIVICIEVIH